MVAVWRKSHDRAQRYDSDARVILCTRLALVGARAGAVSGAGCPAVSVARHSL